MQSAIRPTPVSVPVPMFSIPEQKQISQVRITDTRSYLMNPSNGLKPEQVAFHIATLDRLEALQAQGKKLDAAGNVIDE